MNMHYENTVPAVPNLLEIIHRPNVQSKRDPAASF
jgi:hypothetical protein